MHTVPEWRLIEADGLLKAPGASLGEGAFTILVTRMRTEAAGSAHATATAWMGSLG